MPEDIKSSEISQSLAGIPTFLKIFCVFSLESCCSFTETHRICQMVAVLQMIIKRIKELKYIDLFLFYSFVLCPWMKFITVDRYYHQLNSLVDMHHMPSAIVFNKVNFFYLFSTQHQFKKMSC